MPELPMKEREKTEQIEVWGKDKKRERLGGGGSSKDVVRMGWGRMKGWRNRAQKKRWSNGGGFFNRLLKEVV